MIYAVFKRRHRTGGMAYMKAITPDLVETVVDVGQATIFKVWLENTGLKIDPPIPNYSPDGFNAAGWDIQPLVITCHPIEGDR